MPNSRSSRAAPERPPFGALAMICALYVTQGVPMGVAFEALPAILRKSGFSTEAIGLIGLMMIPWAVKFLWAPFVDRFGGGQFRRRRSWIVPAQLSLAGLFFLIAFLPEEDGVGATALFLLLIANIVAATQDIATDGLAVETFAKENLGWANSMQIGGFALGMLIGGGLMVVVYDQGGWALSFGALGVVLLVSLIPVLRFRPAKNETATAADDRATRPSLLRTVRRSGAGYMISIAATFYFGRAVAASMTGAFLVDIGFSLSAIGLANSIGIAAFSVFGALLGGYLVRRFGAPLTAIAGSSIAALSLFLWLIPAQEGMATLPVVLGVKLVNGVTISTAYVAFFALFMGWASHQQAGTDFSFLQCTETCTNVVAFMLGGVIAGAIGFEGNFVAGAVISLALLAWILFALGRLRKQGSLSRPTGIGVRRKEQMYA